MKYMKRVTAIQEGSFSYFHNLADDITDLGYAPLKCLPSGGRGFTLFQCPQEWFVIGPFWWQRSWVATLNWVVWWYPDMIGGTWRHLTGNNGIGWSKVSYVEDGLGNFHSDSRISKLCPFVIWYEVHVEGWLSHFLLEHEWYWRVESLTFSLLGVAHNVCCFPGWRCFPGQFLASSFLHFDSYKSMDCLIIWFSLVRPTYIQVLPNARYDERAHSRRLG